MSGLFNDYLAGLRRAYGEEIGIAANGARR
jgi:hypothetical protein